MSTNNTAASLAFMAALLPGGANAQTPTPPPQDRPIFQDTVQVTATRFGEAVAEVPGSINVITGDEIRARGATDLRTALALLGGVSVAPGGDSGPAGAVPGLLGVREVDDLLLLIDGIPAGGAFVPGTTSMESACLEHPAFERHYWIGELAEVWKRGRETVRLLVKDVSGVIEIRLGRTQEGAHDLFGARIERARVRKRDWTRVGKGALVTVTNGDEEHGALPSPRGLLIISDGGPASGFGAVIPPWFGHKSRAVTTTPAGL